MVIGDPNEEDTTVGATISPQQASIVLDYIQGAREEVRFCVRLRSKMAPEF